MLGFLPDETAWVSDLFKSIYQLCTTAVSFQLFEWPVYLGQVFFIYSICIQAGTVLVTSTSFCPAFSPLQVSSYQS